MIKVTNEKHNETELSIEILAAPKYKVTAIINISNGEIHIRFS